MSNAPMTAVSPHSSLIIIAGNNLLQMLSDAGAQTWFVVSCARGGMFSGQKAITTNVALHFPTYP